MTNPKFKVGDRVQVIVNGVVKIPDTHITRIQHLRAGDEISFRGKEGYIARNDYWIYMDHFLDGWNEESVIFPYPEEQLDPAYERMVSQINFSIGEPV